MLDEEEVDWTVIECKRRALTGTVKRLMIDERRFPPLDVGGRQGSQGPRDVAKTQVGEMPLLQRRRKGVCRQTLNSRLLTAD